MVFALDGDRLQLTSTGERMDDVTNARARRKRGEKGLDLILSCQDSLTQEERDKGRKRGRLAGVGAGLDLLGEARCDRLPERWLTARLRDGNNTQLLPEFREGTENSSLCHLFAKITGQRVRAPWTIVYEQGVGVSRKRRHLCRPGGRRRLLPGLVAAQSKDVGEGSSRDDEIRRFGCRGWKPK